jgi:chorismate synthase
MVRFLTAGESHGRALVVILEGIPAGLPIDIDSITRDLKRRQGGYGRGRRMAIESDRADIISGVRAGQTIGGPIAMLIENRDWVNWQRTMHTGARAGAERDRRQSRAGHAAAAGACRPGRHRQVRTR